MRVVANHGFHDLDAQVDREYGETFDAPDARAKRLVDMGVCRMAAEQPKPKPKARKKSDK